MLMKAMKKSLSLFKYFPRMLKSLIEKSLPPIAVHLQTSRILIIVSTAITQICITL